MANPPVNSETFVGSREKPENAFGQNGYQGASSLTPGQTKNAIPKVSPPHHGVESLIHADTVEHRVKTDADGKAIPYAMRSGMTNRTKTAEKVPSESVRRRGQGH